MLLVLTTGGTIDKVYFDAASEYEIGEPTVPHVFREAGVTLEWRLLPLLRKDSLEMEPEDRQAIRTACEDAAESRILITHGTDTMSLTAEALRGIPGKTIVLTGALAPARFRVTDAVFNLGLALGAVHFQAARLDGVTHAGGQRLRLAVAGARGNDHALEER